MSPGVDGQGFALVPAAPGGGDSVGDSRNTLLSHRTPPRVRFGARDGNPWCAPHVGQPGLLPEAELTPRLRRDVAGAGRTRTREWSQAEPSVLRSYSSTPGPSPECRSQPDEER